jgi:hypothetical protein
MASRQSVGPVVQKGEANFRRSLRQNCGRGGRRRRQLAALQKCRSLRQNRIDADLIWPLKDQERRALVEILEDRHSKSPTVVTTQTFALRGQSIREKKCLLNQEPNRPSSLTSSLRTEPSRTCRCAPMTCPRPPESLPRSRRTEGPDPPEYAVRAYGASKKAAGPP